ncbi:exodeoxyribonuclease V subunit gamma, partial [Patescibacteria group bacterium]|nr:exodeoxyribonuclease V subunit gamma [Patescibacteria group bacterium]
MKKLFSSNSIEVLALELQSQIVGNSTFFTNNYIIVPNKQVKNWLMLFFAKQSQENIAMNLSFYNANRVIDLYQNISKKKVSEKYFDYLELNFYIEQKIVSIINNFEKLSIEEKKIIQPLLNYLDFNGSFSKKSKNRLVSLCEELTDQFLKYGIYAKEILEETSIDNWQRHLWKEIFIKEKKLFPLRDLKVENLNIREGNFYFFALSHLPSIFFDLSINFSEVNHFILSPCLHFWEDICSDYERKSIEKQWKRKKITKSTKEDLQFYLKERNPLLANMGRELRKYLKETGNYENLNIYEDYQNKEIEYLDWENGICNKSFLLLEGVQLDLLFMRNPEKSEPINLDKNDNSIEIHGANSKLREIEILHDNILRMVAKEGVDLSEILVLSPEIKEYEPYIKLVFDGNENYLDYKISDIDLSSQSFFIRGLFDLFFLYSSKWDFSSVKSLFENPFFQSKHLLSKEEVFQIFKWFEKTNLSWGIEAKHRIEKLEPKIEISKEDLELGTWEYSIKRILFGFVFMMNQKEIMGEFNYEPPIEGLDLSQGDILNKFLKAFNQLKENISFINEEHFLIDWNKFLLNLAKENFEISGADNNENNAYQQYLFFAERLKDIGTDLKDQKFSFCTIFNHFKREIYHKKTSINSNEVSAVQFCSILSGAVIPKKVKYLIGMNDEYPKSEYLNSLKLFKLENEPSNVEKQRMAFLNILITTKEKLLISFISENENCFPSIFIQELQSYLDRAYTINRKEPSKEIVNIHPA